MVQLDSHGERSWRVPIEWLRTAASDAASGVVLMASLVLGVAAAGGDRPTILVAGLAVLIAGPAALAAGRCFLTNAPSDAALGDLAPARADRTAEPEAEITALAGLYAERGLDQRLARRVAVQLLAKHSPEARGASVSTGVHSIAAALASAAALAAGAAPAILTFALTSPPWSLWLAGGVSLSCLATLGALADETADRRWKPMIRATGSGALAIACSIGGGLLVRLSA